MSLFVIGSIVFNPFGAAAGPVPGGSIAGSLNASAVVETLNQVFVVRFGPPVLTSAAGGTPLPAVDATSAPFAYMANLLPGKITGLMGASALPIVNVLGLGSAAAHPFTVSTLDTNTIEISLSAVAAAGFNIVAVLLSSETPAS